MAEGSVEELIARLRDFRTRSAAADALVALGPQAVPPLLEALERESQEGARWAILNCLGEIGDPRAVPALANHLQDPDYQGVAHDALVRIAGHDIGATSADWIRWIEQERGGAKRAPSASSEPAPAADRELADGDLLEQALEGTGAVCRQEGGGRYAVEAPLPGGGTRAVTVAFGGRDHEGSPIVVVYAVCGPARPEQYEAALRMNLRMPYGALALRDFDDRPHFVTFNTILRKALTPVELRKSVLTIAERSARMGGAL